MQNMAYVGEMDWLNDPLISPDEREKMLRLDGELDQKRDERNSFRKYLRNRIDQARWRERKAQEGEAG